ncbi:MAG TPA: hypothetical protein G4O08_02400 [Anaerolineae bacterium]|nr:hypothetical protein [Anaerolineae bacterium]
MTESPLDLAKLFSAVTDALSEKQDLLNEEDHYNNNHGDNMVSIFDTITKAVSKKKRADAGEAFSYASRMVKEKHTSGSSQAYAQALAQAADTFKSKQVTPENAFGLIQTLLGGGAPAADTGGDILGSLLSGLAGGQQTGSDGALDAGDLLSAGMAFLQARQEGDSAAEAIIQAVVSGGALGSSSHRSTSGQLIGNTLMKLLGGLGN